MANQSTVYLTNGKWVKGIVTRCPEGANVKIPELGLPPYSFFYPWIQVEKITWNTGYQDR